MNILPTQHSPLRIFAFSGLLTLLGTLGVLISQGLSDTIVILILIAVEIAFSFDNAIINAKTLGKLSDAWQRAFLTVGIVIAVLGMRIIFPILIVSFSTHLPWSQVVDLALHHPAAYAAKLELAHPAISTFGGAFLLMLALEFFVNDRRKVVWLRSLERPLQRLSSLWAPALISCSAVILIALLPGNHHRSTTLIAGILGLLTHIAIELFTNLFGAHQVTTAPLKALSGKAALSVFIYLEILDASFSFDGVIGAFAVTDKVLLIALGLGIGALWVRSLTVFMVRKGTLQNYIYLEHGAHYTVAVLAFVLLLGVLINIPDLLAGLVGIGFIGASVIASQQALKNRKASAH